MQYDSKLVDFIFDNVISVVLAKHNFKAVPVKYVLQNDSIPDEIIAQIKACRFAIVDLTGQNNGVYFELGYAKGLGRDVILTCRDNDFDNRHFDIKHINTVKWGISEKEIEQFAYSLSAQIEATIGSEVRLTPKDRNSFAKKVATKTAKSQGAVDEENQEKANELQKLSPEARWLIQVYEQSDDTQKKQMRNAVQPIDELNRLKKEEVPDGKAANL
jgi:nucleoside 2-deoxyribosyltransferase